MSAESSADTPYLIEIWRALDRIVPVTSPVSRDERGIAIRPTQIYPRTSDRLQELEIGIRRRGLRYGSTKQRFACFWGTKPELDGCGPARRTTKTGRTKRCRTCRLRPAHAVCVEPGTRLTSRQDVQGPTQTPYPSGLHERFGPAGVFQAAGTRHARRSHRPGGAEPSCPLMTSTDQRDHWNFRILRALPSTPALPARRPAPVRTEWRRRWFAEERKPAAGPRCSGEEQFDSHRRRL